MQLGAIFMDQTVFNVELPKADAEVIPGVPWGANRAPSSFANRGAAGGILPALLGSCMSMQ